MSLGRIDAAGYYKSAIARGFEPLPYMAMRAIIAGQTTIEEVLRSAVTADEFLRDGPLIAPIIKMNLQKIKQR